MAVAGLSQLSGMARNRRTGVPDRRASRPARSVALTTTTTTISNGTMLSPSFLVPLAAVALVTLFVARWALFPAQHRQTRSVVLLVLGDLGSAPSLLLAFCV